MSINSCARKQRRYYTCLTHSDQNCNARVREKSVCQVAKPIKQSNFALLQPFTISNLSQWVKAKIMIRDLYKKKMYRHTKSQYHRFIFIYHSLTTPPSYYCDLLHVPDIVNHRWIWWNWDWVVAVSELSVPGRLLGLRAGAFLVWRRVVWLRLCRDTQPPSMCSPGAVIRETWAG